MRTVAPPAREAHGAPERGRVAIVYPRANLDTVPSLVNAADLLAAHGFGVDLLTYTRAGQAPPAFDSPLVRVRSLGVESPATAPPPSAVRGALRRAPWMRLARGPLVRGYTALGAGLAGGSRALARARGALHPRPETYRCLIGVDPDGLVLAGRLARGAPVAYYSLELLLSYEVRTPADERLKAAQRRLARAAPFVVVQDAERGRLLAEDDGVPDDRLVFVPNAPLGPARRRPTDVWHRRFGLRPEQRVALHAGSLGDWTGIRDIVASVPAWPEPWVLVVHTRYDAESSAYVERLRAAADERRVCFSLKPVPRQAYDDLVDGADAGLAFYVPSDDSPFTQRNVATIGLSSGKLAYYLRAGLPAVVNASASVAPLLEREGAGVAVADAAGIPAALAAIHARHSAFSQAACAVFDRHLDPTGPFEALVRHLDRLGTAGASA